MSGTQSPSIESLTAQREGAMRDLFDEKVRRELLNLELKDLEATTPKADEERMALMMELMELQDQNSKLEEFHEEFDNDEDLVDDMYCLDLRISKAKFDRAQKEKGFVMEDAKRFKMSHEWEKEIRDMNKEEVHLKKEVEAIETIVRNTTPEEKIPLLEELFNEKRRTICAERFFNTIRHFEQADTKEAEENNHLLKEMIDEYWPQKPGRTPEQIETDRQLDIQLADLSRDYMGDRYQYRLAKKEQEKCRKATCTH